MIHSNYSEKCFKIKIGLLQLNKNEENLFLKKTK
jgi:hypothetical protein